MTCRAVRVKMNNLWNNFWSGLAWVLTVDSAMFVCRKVVPVLFLTWLVEWNFIMANKTHRNRFFGQKRDKKQQKMLKMAIFSTKNSKTTCLSTHISFKWSSIAVYDAKRNSNVTDHGICASNIHFMVMEKNGGNF